jgi:hypothetical protein
MRILPSSLAEYVAIRRVTVGRMTFAVLKNIMKKCPFVFLIQKTNYESRSYSYVREAYLKHLVFGIGFVTLEILIG